MIFAPYLNMILFSPVPKSMSKMLLFLSPRSVFPGNCWIFEKFDILHKIFSFWINWLLFMSRPAWEDWYIKSTTTLPPMWQQLWVGATFWNMNRCKVLSLTHSSSTLSKLDFWFGLVWYHWKYCPKISGFKNMIILSNSRLNLYTWSF